MITETIPINYKYDITVDALMIKVDKYEHETSVPLTDDIIMDLNEKGEFIALEILNASHVLDTTPESLENITNIDLTVKVNDYQIFINSIFTLPVKDHEEIKATNATTTNDINIPFMDARLATA
jgi:uncharacterized protein YuzE